MRAALICLVSFLGLPANTVAQSPVSDARAYTDSATGITVVSAGIDLPAEGTWHLEATAEGPLVEVFLVPSAEALVARQGARQHELRDRRAVRGGQHVFRQIYWACLNYAQAHEGIAPDSLDDLDPERDGRNLEPHRDDLQYVPARPMLSDPEQRNSALRPATIMAFEVRPPVDDGKHWVLYTDGRVERQTIDPSLFEKHGAELVPGQPAASERLAERPQLASYRLYARQVASPTGSIGLSIADAVTGVRRVAEWDVRRAAPGPRELLTEWATVRMRSLPVSRETLGASVFPHWFRQASRLYGMDAQLGGGPRPGERSASVFGVLGGRAAIRETLQMQSLAGSAAGERSVPLASIDGVMVTSHPFEQMLGGAEGGRLELADLIPHDRFLAYFSRPASLLEFLDGGTDFIFNTGSSVTGHSLEYRLKERYLSRLGLDESWLRALLTGGSVEELAVFLPDLFLIDGTDMTVVARLRNPTLADAALKLVGIADLSDRTVKTTGDGEQVFWARRDAYLVISTHADELERVLDLQRTAGEGSLGRSAEFRYMLTKLPVEEPTTLWVYFSDPFIRRLVGPQMKIAQLRRLAARSELEAVNAGMLLYRLDGQSDRPPLDGLVREGYAPALRIARDAVWDESLGAVSPHYGRPGRMRGLLSEPVELVTPAEAKAYEQYVENYSRYWRRFFDPIAIRMDQPDDTSYELSVFILPLIENTIYNGLRDILRSQDAALPLAVPDLEPEPVAMLSFNLGEEAWLQTSDNLGQMLESMLGLDGRLLDYLGPDVHVALGDGDPIVGLGSGELANVFGAFMPGGFDSGMLWIPVVASFFTQPSSVLIGLTEPETVSRLLASTTNRERPPGGRTGFGSGSLHRVSGKEAWIYNWDIEGLLKIRFGLELHDRYLVVRNQPLTQEARVRGRTPAALGDAQLLLQPGACVKRLPSLFASAADRQRGAAMAGISSLYPFMATGAGSIEEARETHRRWFGFAPVHPPPGRWQWADGELTSSTFGGVRMPRQPSFEPGDRDFGVFRDVQSVKLSMRFEDDGLRTIARWRTR